jgi:hypothetical protein
VTVSKLTERLGLIRAAVTVFEDTDWNEQRVAATRQGSFLADSEGEE